jgi:L-2-hydroxyglutarate oxidase LhgO
MDCVDTLVIGAGVVGLAIARALARAGHEVVVVEAGSGIGQGVSSRSSEVMHAGLYYAPGTLKASLCVRGQGLLYDFCARHGVAHARCGKLVLATAQDQHAALHAMQRRAGALGAALEPLSATQVQRLEPALRCTAALWSPATGIVDSHALMLALQGDLERAGGSVAVQSRVCGAEFARAGSARVQVGVPGGAFELRAAHVINAAGLGACALARAFTGLDAAHVPRAWFAKGSYFTLPGAPPFSHLIYPLPVDAWLGVHVTLDLAGQVRFGPDLEWLDADDAAGIDYRVDVSRTPAFEAAIRRYWPGLPAGALQAAYSGVRPRIHGPGEPAPDFRIDGPAMHGVPGLVNLLGIESPGLTAALAIGEHVAAMCAPG